jgi:hypothetical protein
MEITVFWYVMPCTLERRYQRFEGNRCPYLQDSSVSSVLNIILSVKYKYKLSTSCTDYVSGTRQRSWLRHYSTSRKVAGSSPDEVIGYFSIYRNLSAAQWP